MATETHQKSSNQFEDFILQIHRVSAQLLDFGVFSKHGVSVAEWSILKILGSEPLRIVQISRRAGISRQRVTHLVDRLEAKGLVKFVEMSDAGRRFGIVTSNKAERALTLIARELQDIDIPSAKPLVPKLNRLLARLGRSMRSARAEAERTSGRVERKSGSALANSSSVQ